ncbi:hypothetical protein Patl1_34343 [Pistacia atlantica]|uniref:Uncharacterized protein n=1 Tax=Pistacia atlantica TaxID=434234 RepID=A0ACC0ZUB9_9ROSI|nr:hypothetical protein Patl1_34343 [Pistacia atlantica]
MAAEYMFTDDDMVVDDGVGYPKAYAKICRDRGVGLHTHGPPFCFRPYSLQPDETLRAKELEKMFPIIDPKAKPTNKPKIFLSLLWKQLNHLGNAGFDPTVIRVDPYGNVLYYHADSASPLAWDIDHWFPCSRGGLTVPSNLRIIQRQVYKRKHHKLEFLVPWHRGFSFLFLEGENEEINDSQTVESHCFPHHFIESKEKLGLAPAAIMRSQSPAIARKGKQNVLKENENPDFVTNPYQAIVLARDSLKQREESQKMQFEIQKLEDDVSDMRRKNEEEKLAIQDLEFELIKRRRRAEKCRRLAEAQNSYRTMLEKMIRDAMHQSVVYKEQVRLNQAATNALMARLEAQKAICDASEKELHKKFKQREEIENQLRPELEQARKRSRMEDTLFEEKDSRTVLYLPGVRPRTPLHKELRMFPRGGTESIRGWIEHDKSIVAFEDHNSIEDQLKRLEIGREKGLREPEIEEDEESRKQRGKGNVEKWLQMLLDNAQEEQECQDENPVETGKTDDIIKKLDQKYPQKDKDIHVPEEKDVGKRKEEKIIEIEPVTDKINAVEASKVIEGIGGSQSFEGKERMEKQQVKEKSLVRSESARGFRRIPSSPSLILKKGVDCMRKKPLVIGDDEVYEDHTASNNFIKSSIKNIKRAVKI